MPVYNGQAFLESAINSALAQTYSNIELIVIDDCSTDSSAEVIESLASGDRRIRFYRNNQRLGLFDNYNECMRRARGEFIKPFAQDDVLSPFAVERMLELFRSNEHAALVSCARRWIDEQGIDVSDQFSSPSACHYFAPGAPIAREQVLRQSIFPLLNFIGEPCAVLFPRALIADGFSNRFSHLGDFEYWIRLLLAGSFVCTQEVLCSVRSHSGRQTIRNFENLSVATDVLQLARTLGPAIQALGYSCDEFLADSIVGIGTQINYMLKSGQVNLPQSCESQNEQFFQLAFHALNALGARNSATEEAKFGPYRLVCTNEKRIAKLERHLRNLMADPGWRCTRPLRELNRFLRRSPSDSGGRSTVPGSDVDSVDEIIDRQFAYVVHLRTAIKAIKFSRSWTIRNRFVSYLRIGRRKKEQAHSQH